MNNLQTEYYVVFTCNDKEITTTISSSAPNKKVDNDDDQLLTNVATAIGNRKRELGLGKHRHIVECATYTIGQDTFDIDIRKLNEY